MDAWRRGRGQGGHSLPAVTSEEALASALPPHPRGGRYGGDLCCWEVGTLGTWNAGALGWLMSLQEQTSRLRLPKFMGLCSRFANAGLTLGLMAAA